MVPVEVGLLGGTLCLWEAAYVTLVEVAFAQLWLASAVTVSDSFPGEDAEWRLMS